MIDRCRGVGDASATGCVLWGRVHERVILCETSETPRESWALSVGHREKLGQPQGGDEHRALGDVLALEALLVLRLVHN